MTASNLSSATFTKSLPPKLKKTNSKSTTTSLPNPISITTYWTPWIDNKISFFLYSPRKIIPSELSSKTSKKKSPKSKNKRSTFSRKCETWIPTRKNATLKTILLKPVPNRPKEFNKKSWSGNSKIKSCKRMKWSWKWMINLLLKSKSMKKSSKDSKKKTSISRSTMIWILLTFWKNSNTKWRCSENKKETIKESSIK